VWLVAGSALIYLVATSDHQWMVWRTESAVRADAIVMRLAGRDVSLATFVNGLWPTLFVTVAALSAWGLLKSIWRRGPRPTLTAHA
jgi:hypothetical protein